MPLSIVEMCIRDSVIDAPECAVITALGMDHVKELGPTLADIAAARRGSSRKAARW